MSSVLNNGTNLVDTYLSVRRRSEEICQPLVNEDYGVQPMPDASPPKWHLAHTTWFFETFILKVFDSNYKPFHPQFEYLFNSYYEHVGSRHPRPERGNLSRPTVSQVLDYRQHVDEAIRRIVGNEAEPQIATRIVLGNHHEQQHQELLFTDLKFNLGKNPLFPPYLEPSDVSSVAQENHSIEPLRFVNFEGGKLPIGTSDTNTFCFDNESPQHHVWLEPFSFANRLTTNGEYLEFIKDGGYENPTLWLSDGWQERQTRDWEAPEYWLLDDNDGWCEYSLTGLSSLDENAPVTHVSLYEADAFARWSQRRLPTEFEWETVARLEDLQNEKDEQASNLSVQGIYHPQPCESNREIAQLLGDCWEWTSSAYAPYPGYSPLNGALGEYNGKFMANQFVLRGGSCVTPADHVRITYRNFFYPKDRWQFSGIRLANDVG